MSRLKLTPLLLLCAMLAACATLPTLSKGPSTLPTSNLVPTISCGQHAPDVVLPDYPLPGSDVDAYVTAQAEWGAKAAGSFREEKVLRHDTATCLDALEAKGLIHQGN